ncbi:MAG: hypothetical protein J6T43_02495 [Prevotella sp.]|nr:hypothetical protein [Prevotella sp.]
MEFSKEQLIKLSDLLKSRSEKQLTIKEVQKFIQLDTIDDCKQYLTVMLDFYFDVIKSPEGRKATSYIEDDRNIWMQTLFSEGFHFLSLLDGVGYNKGIDRLNPIVDPSVLFSVARRIYESVIAFEILFVIPDSEDKKAILYNLFMAHGLSERLKNIDEEMRSHNPERVAEEQKDIDECLREIEGTDLYSELDQQTKNIIKNAFGKKFRYIFKEDNSLEFVNYDDADKLLRIKNNMLKGTYSYFSLHGHPSYVSIFQFRDAFKNDNRADTSIMAPHATQCVLAFMSIFIVDYMKLVPEIKAMYDKLEEPRRFAIGMYEDAMRGEKKFKLLKK